MVTRIVILAAGKGKRMHSDIPKVLIPLRGKPIISYLLEAVAETGIDPRPVLVVGHKKEMVMEVLGNQYEYVFQEEQLGTGHAVQRAESLLLDKADNILILYGDHPFLSSSTISTLYRTHEKEGRVLTMVTTTVEDFEDWRAPFYDFGRIIRNKQGEIQGIIELKDTSSEQREIKELNPAFFCFKASWLWPHLKMIRNANASGEYYLTDLVGIAIGEGEHVASIDINPLESIGVNTPVHLELGAKLKTVCSRSKHPKRLGRSTSSLL